MQIFLYILINNILPIFILIFLGYILDKKFELNIYTLSKLNFYIFVPIFAFIQLYSTKLPKEMLKVVIYAILLLLLNYIISTLVANLLKFDLPLKNAFKNSVMFYNSGNIGIPIITLVFSSAPFIISGKTPYLNLALTTQIVILVTQNIFTNTLGFFNASQGSMHWKDSIKSILGMPTIYAIPLAIILKNSPYNLSESPIWPALVYAKEGMISLALITLGVQLSKTKFNFKNSYAYISNVLRLIGGPIIAYILITLLNINGITAQALIISSSVPTAVNTALIAVERNNRPDFASQVVMTSTLFSSITLVFVVYISRILFPII
ncbi:AEC family transporter [Clostridium ganghwense]|uniref:AEC family transporter n=1 Tax=Clostridium ganghwense TaxID=312089 RepID=A0ABT4CVG5_9CLOT|nr:AEC family transporter [Clostridium ganghwense]MCY6372046.1 AEC family transporter [Clostridium ganghwense]